MTARDTILARIRAGLAPVEDRPVPITGLRVDHRHAFMTRDGMVARLTARLRDYGVTVLRVGSEAEIPGTILRRLAERGVTNAIVPPDLPIAWRPHGGGLVEDAGQDARMLDTIGAVISGCALAIAETGSVVLDAGAGQGRRALTLLPDVFLCVVRADQLVGGVPDAIRALKPAVLAGRPVTFVSGPSATADIELDRVVGVHGPRHLDVILLAGNDMAVWS